MNTIKNQLIIPFLLLALHSIHSQTNSALQSQLIQIDSLIKYKKVNEAKESLDSNSPRFS